MELLQLRYFFESAENENFSRTAEKYMVPISSVSASVRRLEKELGCKLFDRSSNRIILNNNGKKLHQALSTAFSTLDDAIDELNYNSVLDNREIRILVRAVRSDITDCICEYNQKYPHAVFNVIFDFGETDFSIYDIIIDEKKDIYTGYESFELFNLKIRMLVNKKSSLLGKKLALKQLSNQNFVSLNEQSNMHKMLIRVCENAGFTPNVVALINDIACHEKMIKAGIGIGLGRESIATIKNDIACLNVSDFNERYIIHTYFKNSAVHGNVKHFLDFLKKKYYKE